MRNFSGRRKQGFAIATVVIMSVVLLGLVSIAFFNTRAQKNTQGILLDQTRAELGAKAILFLAIYKFRLLAPAYESVTNASATMKPFFQDVWLTDFNSKISTSPASVMCRRMGCDEMGISSFTRLMMTGASYDVKRELLRIQGYAICNGKKRALDKWWN